MFRLFRLFVRFVIRPFLEALKSEFTWVPKKVSVDEELKAQLEKLSKEQIKLLLDDKLTKMIFELATAHESHMHEIGALNSLFRKQEERIVFLEKSIDGVKIEISAFGKLLRAMQRSNATARYTKTAFPTEVSTPEIEF